MDMEKYIGVIISIVSSLLVVAVSWGRFSARIDLMERAMTTAVEKQNNLAESLTTLKIEIAKLTVEIKNLIHSYEKS